MRVRRVVAALYLGLYGVLGALSIPMIRDAGLRYVTSRYPDVTWKADPFPIVHFVLCPVALVSAIGVLCRRRWAIWLGTAVMLMEIPLPACVVAEHAWYEQAAALLFSAAFYGIFIVLLAPWNQESTSEILHIGGIMNQRRGVLVLWGKRAGFVILLLLLAGWAVEVERRFDKLELLFILDRRTGNSTGTDTVLRDVRSGRIESDVSQIKSDVSQLRSDMIRMKLELARHALDLARIKAGQQTAGGDSTNRSAAVRGTPQQ
jgi:hypothetical protein